MTRTTQATHRAIAQTWADKVQDLEATIFRLQDELEAANHRIDEVMEINHKLRRVLDEVIADCDSILKEIK